MDKRNFYKGQSVKAEHLNKLQDYSDRGQANLIASLLGYGVVNGFEVSIIEGHIVGVTAGLAFNLAGERLVLSQGQQVNLSQYIPNVGEKIVKLGIILDYIKTEPVLDSMGNTEHTKWVPSVQFILGETLNPETGRMPFELAEIKINPVSVVEIKSTSACFTTLQKQITKTHAFSTEKSSESTIANIDADILNINKKPLDDTIRNIMCPVKSTYTQYPNSTTGFFDETETPKTLFGGTWELLKTVLVDNTPIITNFTPPNSIDPGGLSMTFSSTSYVYPDRTMKVYFGYFGGQGIGCSIIPFLWNNPLYPVYGILTDGGYDGWKLGNSDDTSIQENWITRSNVAESGETVPDIYKERTFVSGQNHMSTQSPSATLNGYWKDPTAPISSDEEKWYAKIWKRI